MTLSSFKHAAPALRLWSGAGALRELASELDRAELRRPVLITSPTLAVHPVLNRVMDALDSRLVACVTDVRPHSPLASVEAAAHVLAEFHADCVIALGGGSSIVTARAASILHGEQRPATELCTTRSADGGFHSPRLTAKKLPVWVVPSTPTNAIVRAGAAVHEEGSGQRLALFDPQTRARGVHIEPEAVASAPPGLVRSASLSTLSMTVEALLGNVQNPLADAPLMHSAMLITEWLPPAVRSPEDTTARIQLVLAGVLSGQGTDLSGGGVGQALAQTLGPRAGVPNGLIEAALLPHVVRFYDVENEARRQRLGRVLGHQGKVAPATSRLAHLLAAHLQDMGAAGRLRDLGIDENALETTVDLSYPSLGVSRAPRVPDRAGLRDLLAAAW